MSRLLLIVLIVLSLCRVTYSAPDAPLLHRGDLQYLGAVRVPHTNMGGSETNNPTLHQAAAQIAHNPPNGENGSLGSLFMMTQHKSVVELQIPDNLLSVLNPMAATINSLPSMTTVLQTPADPSNGQWNNVGPGGAPLGQGTSLGGLLVVGDSLLSSVYAYYDTVGVYSHFVSSATTIGTGFSGFSNLSTTTGPIVGPINTNLAGGGMAAVPEEWQESIGGYSVIGGKGNSSQVSSNSQGNCAFGFNPDGIGSLQPIDAKMLICYPSGYNTIGSYVNFNSNIINNGYNGDVVYYKQGDILVKGLVWPSGTSSVLFFGSRGLGNDGTGTTVYGGNTADITVGGGNYFVGSISSPPAPTVRMLPKGVGDCPSNTTNGCAYDKSSFSKGPHGYPYVYTIWAYDAQWMARVLAGYIIQSGDLPYLVPSASDRVGQAVQPYDLLPYAQWDLSSYTIDPYVSYELNPAGTSEMPFSTGSTTIPDMATFGGVAYDAENDLIYVSTKLSDKVNTSYYPLIHVFRVNVPSHGYVPNSLPALTTFSLPATSDSLTVSGISMGGTNSPTHYCLSKSSTSDNCSWSSTPITNYTFSSTGIKVLFGYVKNATGVSNVVAKTVTISEASDTDPPTVTAFSIPSISTSLTVPITTFTATDNIAVTGYLITESSTPPAAGAAGWAGSAPTNYTFASAGAKTLYAWAKDAAGNVSNAASAGVTITLPTASTQATIRGLHKAIGVTIR